MTEGHSSPIQGKVLHLSTLQGGGAATAAFRLHQGLLNAGVDSSMLVVSPTTSQPGVEWVACTDKEAPTSFWPDILGSWQLELAKHKDRSPYLAFFSLPDSPIGIDTLISGFQIVHLHWIAGMLDLQRFRQTLVNSAVVWTLHDANPFTGGCHYPQACRRYEHECHHCPQLGPKEMHSLFEPARDTVSDSWHKKLAGLRDQALTIACPSSWIHECSRRSSLLGSRPHHHIPYGVDTDVFHPMPMDTARCRLGLDLDASYVLFGATDLRDYRKGIDLFRETIDLLLRRFRHRQFKILLFGGAGQELTDRLPGECIWLGSLAEEKLCQAYAASNVYVLPSREDNLPNTSIEALACGTPVVCFDVGGLSDVVRAGDTGFLVPFPDVNKMADSIAHCLDMQPDDPIRVRCRTVAVTEYALSVQADRYVDLYQQILHNTDPK